MPTLQAIFFEGKKIAQLFSISFFEKKKQISKSCLRAELLKNWSKTLFDEHRDFFDLQSCFNGFLTIVCKNHFLDSKNIKITLAVY